MVLLLLLLLLLVLLVREVIRVLTCDNALPPYA